MADKAKVVVKDWLLVAQVAGKHNIRFPTNWRLEAFLTEIQSGIAVESVSEGADRPSSDEVVS